MNSSVRPCARNSRFRSRCSGHRTTGTIGKILKGAGSKTATIGKGGRGMFHTPDHGREASGVQARHVRGRPAPGRLRPVAGHRSRRARHRRTLGLLGLWEKLFGERVFTMAQASMSSPDPRVELTREFSGALIGLLAVAFPWWEQWRCAKEAGRSADRVAPDN